MNKPEHFFWQRWLGAVGGEQMITMAITVHLDTHTCPSARTELNIVTLSDKSRCRIGPAGHYLCKICENFTL